MLNRPPRRLTLSAGEVTLFGLLGAATYAAKVAMAGMPNVVMLFAVTFGWKAVFPIYVYVSMEFFLYGIQLYSISYLYIWLVLAAAAWLLRGMTHPVGWALLSGVFGLLFGLLCAPVCLFTAGLHGAIVWWINGIPFDVIHCAGNFGIALVLFCPLRRLLERLYQGMQARRGGYPPQAPGASPNAPRPRRGALFHPHIPRGRNYVKRIPAFA